MLALHRRADPAVLSPVELSLLPSDELIEVKGRKYPSESKPVGFGDTVHLVCCDHGARTGHVLDNEGWIAGDIFRHVLADEPRPGVVNVAGGKAGYDPYGFSLVVRRLRINTNGSEENQHYHQGGFF